MESKQEVGGEEGGVTGASHRGIANDVGAEDEAHQYVLEERSERGRLEEEERRAASASWVV